MEKKIEDYLHLYLGCQCMETFSNVRCTLSEVRIGGRCYLVGDNLFTSLVGGEFVKPVLRPLSSMTEEELRELKWDRNDELKHAISQSNPSLYASEFKYLLSKSFDLFGLIEAGLAIDSTYKG